MVLVFVEEEQSSILWFCELGMHRASYSYDVVGWLGTTQAEWKKFSAVLEKTARMPLTRFTSGSTWRPCCAIVSLGVLLHHRGKCAILQVNVGTDG